MATEETELAFIRCPGCRSLVPSVATRCRMCGEPLQAKGSAGQGEDSGESSRSRLRTRTTSVSPTEVDITADQPVADSAADAHKEQPWNGDQAASASSDPFGLDRDPWASGSSQEAEGETVSETTESSFEEPSRADDTSAWGSRSGAAAESSSEGDEDFGDEEEGDDDDSAEFAGTSVEISDAGDRKKRRRRRKKKKRGDLFGAPGQESAPAAPQATNSRTVDFSAGEQSRDDAFRIRGGNETNTVPFRAASARQPETRPQPEVRQPEPQQPRHVEQPLTGPTKVVEPQVDGELLGWFVFYDNTGKGTAREIRSGRFFVGGGQLREGDFVVAHPSVSTPHSMISASSSEGIRVLDMLSERGTSVKRRGTNNFAPQHDQVTLSHGDWIRFGQFEVLVCLIPV